MSCGGLPRRARAAALLLAIAHLGCGGRDALPDAAAPAASAETTAGGVSSLVLQLDEDALARVRVELAPASAEEVPAELPAYGRVLDPAPVTGALTALTAARAAATAATRELKRVEGLARDRDNASAREVEVARATAARARADLAVADYRVDSVLGPARGEFDDLAELADRLGRRQATLARVDVPADAARPEPERGAHLTAYPEHEELLARFLGPAPDVDPQRPGWSFLFLLTGRSGPSGAAGGPPPPGSPVRARLAAGGEATSGVRVPESALLRSQGRLFVFVARGGGRFERRAVTARVLPDGSALASEGLSPGESLVVSGAQQLLSAQHLAAGGGAGEEEED